MPKTQKERINFKNHSPEIRRYGRRLKRPMSQTTDIVESLTLFKSVSVKNEAFKYILISQDEVKTNFSSFPRDVMYFFYKPKNKINPFSTCFSYVALVILGFSPEPIRRLTSRIKFATGSPPFNIHYETRNKKSDDNRSERP